MKAAATRAIARHLASGTQRQIVDGCLILAWPNDRLSPRPSPRTTTGTLDAHHQSFDAHRKCAIECKLEPAPAWIPAWVQARARARLPAMAPAPPPAPENQQYYKGGVAALKLEGLESKIIMR
jgi:hypothetical protein